MRFSIKAKQVAGVTAIVALAVLILSGWYLSSLARVLLEQSATETHLMANEILYRATDIASTLLPGDDLFDALRTDAGLGSILRAAQGSSPAVVYAAIVDKQGEIIVSSDPATEAYAPGKKLPNIRGLDALLAQGPIGRLKSVYAENGFMYDVHEPLQIGEGEIRVAVSTLLIRNQFEQARKTPMYTAAIAIVGAILISLVLAQLVLRPIHVIRSGLARLGRGELNVDVDLPADSDLADLGESFKAVSARLEADRTMLAGQQAAIESVVSHLEDAVALVAPGGAILFANAAMRASLGGATALDDLQPKDHPYRALVTNALRDRRASEPAETDVPGLGTRLVTTQVVAGTDSAPIGVLVVARNVAYLSQVETTLNYSRKLAALGKLSAGIAHEIKNPLNAVMIHLELLKMAVADVPAGREHVSVIAAQLRRLDEVVQGFLKFTRPEDLKLQPVAVASLIGDIMPVVKAEADKNGIELRVDVPGDLPEIDADRSVLDQAFLNLALNGCQAMPKGGRLRIAAAPIQDRRLEVVFEDNGVGIAPEHLGRIFDLYFTTKERGSGIGLSMVYRAVQLHDGDIEVQSMPGRGTTFRVILPQTRAAQA